MVLLSKWFYQTFIRSLKYCELGLFTLHNCCVASALNYLKLKLDSKSRLIIPEYSGYHCTLYLSHTQQFCCISIDLAYFIVFFLIILLVTLFASIGSFSYFLWSCRKYKIYNMAAQTEFINLTLFANQEKSFEGAV